MQVILLSTFIFSGGGFCNRWEMSSYNSKRESTPMFQTLWGIYLHPSLFELFTGWELFRAHLKCEKSIPKKWWQKSAKGRIKCRRAYHLSLLASHSAVAMVSLFTLTNIRDKKKKSTGCSANWECNVFTAESFVKTVAIFLAYNREDIFIRCLWCSFLAATCAL